MDLKGLSNARWKEFPRATRAWKQWYIDHCTAVCHEFSNCQNQYSILKCRPWQNLVKEVVAAKTENQNYSCHLLPSTDLILMSGLVLCALHDMFCDLQMGAANWMYCSKMPLPCSRARVLRFRLLQSTENLYLILGLWSMVMIWLCHWGKMKLIPVSLSLAFVMLLSEKQMIISKTVVHHEVVKTGVLQLAHDSVPKLRGCLNILMTKT